MGKPRVARAVSHRETPRRSDPIKFHDVMIALSEAKAAHWLLDQMASGNLMTLAESDDVQEREVAAWLQGWSLDALGRSLTEAEKAFRKSLTLEQARDQIVGGVTNGVA